MNRIAFVFIVFVIVSIPIISCKEAHKMQKPPMTTQGWLYPDNVYDATGEITDGRHIDVLKPQYYSLNDDGTLTQITSGHNAYSAANVALVKKYSTQQFVTISGETTAINALATNRSLTSAFLSTMITFLQSSGFTGIELDFEGFGQWTPQQYANYRGLVTTIGNALHAHQYKLMVDTPAISDATYQGYYPTWRYDDFNALPVDYFVVLSYDYQSDQGAGSPVSPLAWISGICRWILSKITDHSKIVIGIPNYGYTAKVGTYGVSKLTYDQSKILPGFSTATRDPSSGELMWTVGDMVSDYSDSVTLNLKLQAVQKSGISSVSVWHLGGGGFWFPQQTAPTPAPIPQSTDVTFTQDQIKAIYNALTPDQIETIRNAVAG